MRKLLLLIIAAILVGVSLYAVNNYNASNAKGSTAQDTKIGINPNVIKMKAPNFKLKDLDGKELSLSDLKGKNVFINFWATWCPPCKAEMPEIEKLYQETKNSNLVIVTIEISEPLNEVKSFINNNKYNFKVLLNLDQSASSQYGISSIPTSYFIDKNGYIVSKNIGPMTIDQMRASIKALDK